MVVVDVGKVCSLGDVDWGDVVVVECGVVG